MANIKNIISISLMAGTVATAGWFVVNAQGNNNIATDVTSTVVKPKVTQATNTAPSNNASNSFRNSAGQAFNNTSGEAPPLVLSARRQIGVTLTYDPAYVKLDFPMGDVPMSTGVCTDVIIRAYREQGKDLQALVNRDMKKAWSKYPKLWGLKSTDKNIDHRRVPNLRVFFNRHGKSLGIKGKQDVGLFKAGDMVTWTVGGRPHIGIVSNKLTRDGIPLIIHNIGRGTQENNILFNYKMTGHYRY